MMMMKLQANWNRSWSTTEKFKQTGKQANKYQQVYIQVQGADRSERNSRNYSRSPKSSQKYGMTVALDGVDNEFPQGELTALIGTNGSGKTTLLKILAGLTYPDQGRVRTIDQAPDRINKERFAFLPEDDYLYSWIKLEYLIEFFSRQYTSFNRAKAYQMTEDMN